MKSIIYTQKSYVILSDNANELRFVEVGKLIVGNVAGAKFESFWFKLRFKSFPSGLLKFSATKNEFELFKCDNDDGAEAEDVVTGSVLLEAERAGVGGIGWCVEL